MSDHFKVIVRGAHELEAALTKVVLEVDPALSVALRALADPVKRQAQDLALAWGRWTGHQEGQARTAAGYRVRRRKLAVTVEQSLKKTTGLHPNYGAIQMRHFLIPALHDHETQIEAGVVKVIDDLTGRV